MPISTSYDDEQHQQRTDAPRAQLPITVLMNAGSGSEDKSSAWSTIAPVLQAEGRDVELVLAHHPQDMPMLARQAAQTRSGILVAAGGDGTLNAVANVSHEYGLPFAVIPLGTFNYFARDLGIPLDAAAAARIIVEGHLRRMPAGRINGRLFLNNASIGLYRHLLEDREQHKRRFGRKRLVAMLSGLVTLLRGHAIYRLRIEIDGNASTLSTPSVFFGRNTLQMEQLGLDEAQCVARGELAVLAPHNAGRLALLGLALRGAFARLETASDLHQWCARSVRVDWIDSRPRRMRTAIDGELVDFTLPLLVEALPDALQVVVPAVPEARS